MFSDSEESDLEEERGRVEEERGNIPKLLVMDLRSYTAALGNRAKGGGFECHGKRTNGTSMCSFAGYLVKRLGPIVHVL